jgi:type IV pilus assembly protein PilW
VRRPARRSERGLTLVELAVSIALVGILVAAGMTLLGQQQRALQTSGSDRAMQETARAAVEEIGGNLRRAGFGIEPWLAFDFDGYECTAPVSCRDKADGSDEIVFHARDPVFKAALNIAPTSDQLEIQGGIQLPLRLGQILQVMCPSASSIAYVTVGQEVPANWEPPAAAPAKTTITLLSDAGAFPRQNALLTSGCFAASPPASLRVYRVDRFRYFVGFFNDPDGGAENGRPYLMLDRGHTDDDGTARTEPVVPDVEDLQFEYLFVDPDDGATRTVGAASGNALANDAAGIDLAAQQPSYDATSDDPSRATNHPANIRAVRLSVLVRSPGRDLAHGANPVVQLVSSRGPRIPAAGNRPEADAEDNFTRIRVETTEMVRNLESRGPYFDQ